jgi:predicted acetyltransferase
MTENDVILWSQKSILNWPDFKAEHHSSIFEDSHSTIKFGFTWTVNSDKEDEKIVFLIENILISVEFHPLLSSVRESCKSDELLKHEQGHFDLAELIKNENMESFYKKFYNQKFPTRGQNEDQRKQFAKEDSGKMIVSEIKKLSEILEKRSKEYDDITEFGQNHDKQKEFDLIFDDLHK